MVDLDTFVVLDTQQVPFQESAWTKDILSAFFSQDHDVLPFFPKAMGVCAFCARREFVMVQPCWMLALRAITCGQRAKDMPDIIDSSISLDTKSEGIPKLIPTKVCANRKERASSD